MLIELALRLKPGDPVECPAGSSDDAYRGTVTRVGTELAYDGLGVEYIWVEVQGPVTRDWWQSSRLG